MGPLDHFVRGTCFGSLHWFPKLSRGRAQLLSATLLLAACTICFGQTQAPTSVSRPGNSLTYLDSSDPFYVGAQFPKLTTPQWVGEPGVDAVVILAIDDMTESGRYETFLRPILNRLKKIDGRAPVSIMTRSIGAEDSKVQGWLKEGVSIEAHTLMHPCPLLAGGDFAAAATNYFDCIDLLNRIAGNKP